MANLPGEGVSIAGLGTALPPYIVPQELVSQRLVELLEDARLKKFARWLFRRSGVEARPFVIPDALDPSRSSLYGPGGPSLDDRMHVFRTEAPRLAETAAQRALGSAGVEASEITHLIVVTSTGLYTPGLDVDLVVLLGLSGAIERTLVSMMGCSGAFHGIRVARRAVESNPRGLALVVCVELCSIHLDQSCDSGGVVASSLFGDAAAAVVIRSTGDPGESLAFLGQDASRLEPRYRSALEWSLGERGFQLRLGRTLPAAISETVGPFLQPLRELMTDARDPARVGWWAVHPGGEAILRATERALALQPDALAGSRDVLRRLGNLSSGAVLFALERALACAAEGQSGILLGFGPGLALEAMHAVRGGRGTTGSAGG